MPRKSIDMSGYDSIGPLWERLSPKGQTHLQGACFASDALVFSRSGAEHGHLIWTHNGAYTAHIELEDAHVGGIDCDWPYLIAPTYNHNDYGGWLSIFDAGTLARIDQLEVPGHRVYAAGICHTIGDEYLLAAVCTPDGQQVKFWTWNKASGRFRYINSVKVDRRVSARNNIVLARTMNGLIKGATLYAQRAHLGYGQITAYEVDCDTAKVSRRVRVHRKETDRRRRNGWCSARFGSTLALHWETATWLRTARNIFNNKITYRLDTIKKWRVK